MNIGSVSQSEINITLGDDVCTIRTSSDTVSDFCLNNANTALYRRLTVGHHTNHQVPH